MVSELVRIDRGSGEQTGPAVTITANNLPISITDLALQPGTNTLYGTNLSEDDFINSIYTIEPATGVRHIMQFVAAVEPHNQRAKIGSQPTWLGVASDDHF